MTERFFRASAMILALLLALSLAGNVYLTFVDRPGDAAIPRRISP